MSIKAMNAREHADGGAAAVTDPAFDVLNQGTPDAPALRFRANDECGEPRGTRFQMDRVEQVSRRQANHNVVDFSDDDERPVV